MQTYILGIHDRALAAESADTTLVRTSKGVDEIKVRVYSGEWLEAFSLAIDLYHDGETPVEIPLSLSTSTDTDWLAEATVSVPDSVLTTAGALGVTVHGYRDTDHIITERAYPLTVAHEGDGIGPSPQPNPR